MCHDQFLNTKVQTTLDEFLTVFQSEFTSADLWFLWYVRVYVCQMIILAKGLFGQCLMRTSLSNQKSRAFSFSHLVLFASKPIITYYNQCLQTIVVRNSFSIVSCWSNIRPVHTASVNIRHWLKPITGETNKTSLFPKVSCSYVTLGP